MSAKSYPWKRFCCVFAYFLPAIVLIAAILFLSIPNVFFLYEGKAMETYSQFELLSNAYAECRAMRSGSTEGSTAALYFSFAVTAGVVIFWILFILSVLSVLRTAVCASIAFSHAPTDRASNRAKRAFKFGFPARWLFVLSQILPFVCLLFPLFLEVCYRKLLGADAAAHYFCNPILTVGLLTLSSLALYLGTLSRQKSERLDLFRFYRKKNEP